MKKSRRRTKIQALRDRLVIDREDIDEELVQHPGLVERVGKLHVLAINERESQKEYLKQIEERIASRVRSLLPEKAPQTAIARGIESDAEWIQEKTKHRELDHEVGKWYALREAFTARGYSLHNLAGLAISRMRAEGGQSERDHEGRR